VEEILKKLLEGQGRTEKKLSAIQDDITNIKDDMTNVQGNIKTIKEAINRIENHQEELQKQVQITLNSCWY
jgi:archaellum component FlaC